MDPPDFRRKFFTILGATDKSLLIELLAYFWVFQSIFLWFYGLYARKKNNKSGKVGIQIIDKSSGKTKLHNTVGSSNDPLEDKKDRFKNKTDFP